ncbi:magnesium chelatase ATPase subunit D [Oscillochloris sp. ZM17-4]|uniref:magnesium chelatase ATPase subunit D n=1 Tax=Oscillochloris sp. ZM17-4 TaxID=2866714 RepID=UPI001C73C07A|nr:magnesium chelatase ATPase subunit D [Oscillochloris sp. ZM17-4]MBX0326171.1 magnesium chelatase ATPase subunit D [Oscillochloris sp. ZM17-4]
MTTLPFSALVGLDTARQALLLLAVDPGLGGTVIAAGVGTGKSTLARSFARLAGAATLDTPPPFVELPVGVTEDRLLGGLDLEATLSRGERVHRSGLLARANGGILYADGVNLLDDSTINHLLSSLDSGVVRVEREGLSMVELSRFALIATYDPAEGPPRRHLLDRVGLIVAPIGQSPARARAEVVRRNLDADAIARMRVRARAAAEADNPYDDEEALLAATVLAAREALPTVQISDAQVLQISQSALALGVEGHRADIFAVRAALASAALAGRDEVGDEDMERAVRFVLVPRATRAPEFEDEAQPEQPQQPPPQQEEQPPPPRDEEQQDDEEQEEQPPPPPEEDLSVEDLVLSALDAEVPPDVLTTPFSIRRGGRSGSRGNTSGNRGRHIRSIPGLPGQGRLDVVATLRAAAPWQSSRKAEDVRRVESGRRALSHARASIRLRADDLHIKKFRSKAGTLFCFVVDASGSMALHRMRQAKGAVNALLQQAYVHRDHVALLAFRGDRADLLLPPSQSVELAKRALDVLPTGGGTPLAAALLSAYQVAEQARARGIHRTTLVLITDGRPNVPLQPEPGQSKDERMAQARTEVQTLCGRLKAAGIGAVVIDTQRSYVSRGEAQQLAAWIGGRYVYLPQGRADQIAGAVIEASEG